ncbi:MAG: hypothetical protein P4L33_11585 [Capsulimonadaceae bacterium]|nr:hypothetical protein [Capsulimonadaceae bacterium]
MQGMMPLLIVALLVWAGVFLFILAVDRRLSHIERIVGKLSIENDSSQDKETGVQ